MKKKREKVYDSSYLIRVKKEDLDLALNYCNDNSLLLVNELRRVIVDFSNKQKKIIGEK